MKRLLPLLLLVAPALVHAEVLFSESFEKPSGVRWQKSWGPSEVVTDQAQEGTHALKETLEDKYGMSVHFLEIAAYPGATFRASAWVFVPQQEKVQPPQLSLNRADWSVIAGASTNEQGKWVQLKVEYKVKSERMIRLQLYQVGQKPGLGGGVMYWDNIVVERELGAVKMDEGIKLNPYVLEGLDVTVTGGMKVRVAPGKMDVDGREVTIAAETVFDVAPPRVIPVRDEQTTLSDQEPRSYLGGTALRECTIEGIGLNGALIPESLVVKAAKGPAGQRLVEGTDWRADKAWARVGRLPEGAIKADTPVFVDYDMGLCRIDTLAVRSDGQVVLLRGAEHKTIPNPPAVDQYARALCNVYLPAGTRELKPELLYPIGPPFPSATEAELQRNAALIPQSRARLEAGQPFTLLFWGDSVTCGGTASVPEKAFPQAFTTWLRNRYPQTPIKYVNAGTGGWNSDSKLPLFDKEVLAHKPDLVVIEFVNDMGMDRAHIFKNYTDAVTRLRAIGAEVIILTPHFTRPDWMGAGTNMRTPEPRPAVTFMKEFAAENKVGLADASRRWEHLWIEGLPYLTLENNAINHPDDRGHALFVEELQKFFP